MTWATPFGSEVAQVRSPGSLHNRWCCDPELKPPADLLEPLTAHVTWIVLLAHSWSLHGLNKIVNRFLRRDSGVGTGATRATDRCPPGSR
ncbi:hypothetical protein BRN29_16755 [Xanthomonas oryzae pv. oryzae]|nr:hypothetical protein BRN29_16755 [Xanthomonas oryzae pv. oryzae]